MTITKPDGTTETKGPYTSDPTGSTWFYYAPTQIGTYQFQFSFPGQQVNGTDQYGNRISGYYQPSTSPKVPLTVQQNPILPYPETPLPKPNEYWQRPIYGTNREWNTIAGNWLMQSYNTTYTYNLNGGFNPYTTAPNTAHVVWTKPLAFGGVVGGELGDHSYYTGLSYEFKMVPPIIMNGILYYNTPDYPQYGWYAVDIRNGKTLWWHNSTDTVITKTYGTLASWPGYPQLTLGQLYDNENPNQHGVIPYLWAINGPPNRYDMYDAFTGNWILSFANSSRGMNVLAQNDGSLLVYVLNGAASWLTKWNSSKAILAYPGLQSYPWLWRPPQGVTLDWNKGIEWNVTTPVNKLPYSQALYSTASDVLLAVTGSWTAPGDFQVEIGYSAVDGHVMWVQNRTTASGATTWGLMGALGEGVYTEFVKETMQWYGYDITTGQKVWGPTEAYTSAWGMYNGGYVSGVAYGKLYAAGYDGMIHCYNVHTGAHLWDYSAGVTGYETVYGVYPLGFHRALAIADGKVFIVTGEHSPSDPLWRGSSLHVIDANTGKAVWKVLGWLQNPAIADGYLVANNGYDNQIYCFGKGQTATTISASPVTIASGGATTIQGTVTDQSPGQTCLGIPAAGTPAISDASMSPWMEYLYMQQPKPTNATGVPVTLTAFDPNGNTENIGTVTSDITGGYGISWTPPVPGLYTITATFAGSNSYYSSSSETHITLSKAAAAQPVQMPAQTATPLPTATQTPSAQVTATPVPPPSSPSIPTTYITIAIVAIIVVVAAAALALRRRK